MVPIRFGSFSSVRANPVFGSHCSLDEKGLSILQYCFSSSVRFWSQFHFLPVSPCVSWLAKRFRQFRFPVPVRFLHHPGSVRSEKLQNESSPNFGKFSSRSFSRIFVRIFPEFLEDFSCFVFQETETTKIHQKSRHFSMPNPHTNAKKKFTKRFWRGGKVRIRKSVPLRF